MNLEPRCRGGLGVLMAIAMLLIFTDSRPATAQDLDPDHLAEAEASKGSVPPPFMPDDRCQESELRLLVDGKRVVAGIELWAALDGDTSTALELRPGAAVELHFRGAPRWLNQITPLTDASHFDIEVLDLDRHWLPYRMDVEGAREKSAVLVEGEPVKVRGLRFRAKEGPSKGGSTQLFEMAAWFKQEDPDKEMLPQKATGILEYFWANDYPGSNNDLSLCDDDARGLRDHLPGSWTKWGHGNNNARERYIKRQDMGGSNQYHNDAADLSYFAGHGTGSTWDSRWGRNLGAPIWGNQNSDDSTTPPGDALGAWGNYNLEWMVFASCQTLRDYTWGYWATVFDRLHLLLGAHTNIADAKYGRKFGDYMVDNGIFDSAKKVKTSWFDVIEKYNGNYTIAVVLGETGSMGNDYIWGQGPVASDPTHNGWYNYWWFNTGANKQAAGPLAMLRPQPSRSASAVTAGTSGATAGQDAEANPLVFEAKTERGHKVIIDQSLLQAPKLAEMPFWIVTGKPADPNMVRDIGSRICQTEGVLCDGEVGPGNPGSLNLVDGAYELRVCEQTGSFHYEDTRMWMEWMDRAPQLLEQGQAVELAQQVLESWGLLPPDAANYQVDELWQGRVNAENPERQFPDDSQTFPVATRVVYQRQLSIPGGPTFPVWGPGGSMTVMLGEDGKVQRVFQEGWRGLTMGQSLEVRSVEEIVDELNTRGSDATLNGITLIAENIEIRSWSLGYYEPDCDAPLQAIRPVYVLETLIQEESGQQSDYRMFVTADSQGPGAEIVDPPEGNCFDQGDQVCLTGISQTGVAPLSFEWFDEAGNLLGTDNVVCITMPAPAPGHNVYDDAPTVELVITDGNGDTSNASRSLCYGKRVSAPTPPRTLALYQNHPNPFNPSTEITFALPAGTASDVQVRLQIFDTRGRLVRTLVDDSRAPGQYSVSWHGRDDSGRVLASGVYYYRLEAGEDTITKRMALLK